jgi:seryl-tRNA synthetase
LTAWRRAARTLQYQLIQTQEARTTLADSMEALLRHQDAISALLGRPDAQKSKTLLGHHHDLQSDLAALAPRRAQLNIQLFDIYLQEDWLERLHEVLAPGTDGRIFTTGFVAVPSLLP